jgi:hypothetical protein
VPGDRGARRDFFSAVDVSNAALRSLRAGVSFVGLSLTLRGTFDFSSDDFMAAMAPQFL